MTGEAERILNLDEDTVVAVTLGNRNFSIRQQRRAVLERVLLAMHPEQPALPEGAEDEENLSERELATRGIETWERHLDAFALMLGVEASDANFAETIQHLEEHLTWPKARKVFEKWWELNEMASFFVRVGNALIPETMLDQFLNLTAEERRELIEKVRARASETSSAS